MEMKRQKLTSTENEGRIRVYLGSPKMVKNKIFLNLIYNKVVLITYYVVGSH